MADLYLYNTASRSKERFEPSSSVVGMYCCGPTVYDFAHIGNLRTYVWEDVLKRTLRVLGHTVRHVVNITDVGHLTSDADTGEDKIEKGARREGKSAWEIAEYYTRVFKTELKALNCGEPDTWCAATGHIPEMVALVKTLEEKGFTYRTGDGIYFDTSKFPRYCDFARLDPESLQAGARIDMGDKRHPTDFALWKFSPAGVRRQMEWESPWGTGFPGWHIECSAMSLKYLSQPIDIHCGGQEHVRVHHTNEIAQSEAATGKQFVNYWVHGEWLMFGQEKMAKSEGGTVTLSALGQRGIPPLAYRMFVFSAHHRSPLNFTWEGLAGALQGLRSLKRLIAEAQRAQGEERAVDEARVDGALSGFREALCDDLNTPKAVAAVWEIVRDSAIGAAEKIAAVRAADEVLALDLLVPDAESRVSIDADGMKVTVVSPSPLAQERIDEIVRRVLARKVARKSRQFAEADRLRTLLATSGVEVKDLAGGAVECVVR